MRLLVRAVTLLPQLRHRLELRLRLLALLPPKLRQLLAPLAQPAGLRVQRLRQCLASHSRGAEVGDRLVLPPRVQPQRLQLLVLGLELGRERRLRLGRERLVHGVLLRTARSPASPWT